MKESEKLGGEVICEEDMCLGLNGMTFDTLTPIRVRGEIDLIPIAKVVDDIMTSTNVF